MNLDPRTEYLRRLEERRASAARSERRHRQMGNGRLVLVLAACVVAVLAFARSLLSPLWLLPLAAGFLVLAILHERVIGELRRVRRAIAYYEKALARLEDRWAGSGETGERFLDDPHPYATDLDLFGRGSLFELISTARTRSGEQILADWLRSPSPPAVIRRRQEAVEELRLRLDLREDLAVLGEDVRTGVHPQALAHWAEQPALLGSRAARVTAAVLSVLGVLSLAAWAAFGFLDLVLLMAVIDAAFMLRFRRRLGVFLGAIDEAAHDLALLSQVLVRLENESFTAGRLIELRAALDTEGWPPSRRIARLNRLMELLDSRDNLFVRMIDPVVLWSFHCAFAIEVWRRKSGAAVRRWLEASGEIEALCALAGYACEHPQDSFAEFSEQSPVFEADGLAHPLLPESRAVRNDLRLDAHTQVLIVSGSNMSGKSTLLRAVGVNTVLAQTGAPVRAARLRLSPLAPGASIRILDSLQDGTSRFYAEIKRLRRIVDLTAGPAPLLFLIDEFLHGTNSHDRRIGAEAIVRGLVERGAIGLITTHDLALAEIAEALAPRAANVHFEDHLENGQLRFDYRLRPGVVQKSNALELMRSVGLNV